MSEWQPIETAPKDGTVVLLYQPDGCWRKTLRKTQREYVFVGYWHRPGNPEKDGFWCSHVAAPQRPTHWMPLPEPPK